MCVLFFFFFSSRRRHTRLTCDWSSDVCSSDLVWTRDRWRSAGRGSRCEFRSARSAAAPTAQRPHWNLTAHVSLLPPLGQQSQQKPVPELGSPARSRAVSRSVFPFLAALYL